MSQNDFTIANQGFPAFRADLNTALQALASNNSGTSAPSTTFANMWWYDSTNNIMYIRNEDNDAWIKFAELDQTNDKFILSGTLQLDDGTVSAPALTFNSDTNMGLYRGGTDILKFVTAGTDAITIDASQNVGIGATSATNGKLLVSGASGTLGGVSAIAQFAKGATGGGIIEVGDNTAILQMGSEGTNAYLSTGNNALRFLVNSAERMRIDSTGAVGIGNSVMSSMSTDSNNLVVGSGSGNEGITIYSATNGTGNIYYADGSSGGDRYRGWLEYSHSSDYLAFGTAGAERMRINSSGNVAIGGQEGTSSIANQRLLLAATVQNGIGYGLFIHNDSFLAASARISLSPRYTFSYNTSPYIESLSESTSAAALVFGTTTGTTATERMRIDSSGRLLVGTSSGTSYHLDVNNASGSGVVAYFHATSGTGIYLSNGATSWTGTSDETLKENITELDKQESYDNIKNIRAVNFNFKTDTANDVRLGFIAQDWQTEYPESVVVGADNKLGLNYTDTISVLLSALQKAQEKIEAMEARITALEGA